MPGRKHVVIVAAVVMQACLGGIYAWSAFVPPLQAGFGYSAAQTQLVFGTCVCVFTLSVIFAGRLQDRRGPRLPAMISGALLGASYLLASVGGWNFWLLWLSIGVVGGLGIGFGYVCPIATAIKWFPRHKGLVGGLAVAGYGGGAIVLSAIAELLMKHHWDVLSIFRWVGVGYGGVVILAGSQLVAPAPAAAGALPHVSRRRLLKDGRFWALFCGMFCATLPGLTIIGPLKKIGLSFNIGNETATLAISTLAVGNGLGRVAWGLVYDRLGGRRSLTLSFCLIAVSAILLIAAAGGGAGFLAAAALVGFCYGGCFALYPAEVARIYGVHVMGGVYPLVLLAHGIAAQAGPPLGGLGFDLTGTYITSLIAVCVVPVAGLTIYYLLSRREEAGKLTIAN